jgi:hypothetical protein
MDVLRTDWIMMVLTSSMDLILDGFIMWWYYQQIVKNKKCGLNGGTDYWVDALER